MKSARKGPGAPAHTRETKTAGRTPATGTPSPGFTAEERSAMRERTREPKAARRGVSPANMAPFTIAPIAASPVGDAALERLLHEAYVDGGFTEPGHATTAFAAAAVKARGTVLVAYDSRGEVLGSITLVPGESAARRLAEAGEAELHLLCVRRTARGSGIGRALVEAALDLARRTGVVRVLLWTQPAMRAAQRLYEGFGFRREPIHDFARGERRFLVYACALRGPGAPEASASGPA